MLLIDVNVLIYAHRTDVADHLRYREWLESAINSDVAYGMSNLVLSGQVSIKTDRSDKAKIKNSF